MPKACGTTPPTGSPKRSTPSARASSWRPRWPSCATTWASYSSKRSDSTRHSASSIARWSSIRGCRDPPRARQHAAAPGVEPQQALAAFQRAVRCRPGFPEAHFSIYQAAQVLGNKSARARSTSAGRWRCQRIYFEPAAKQPATRRLLLLCVAGTWEANIPADYFSDPLTTDVWKYFLEDGEPERSAEGLPAYDLAFNLIAESDAALPALDRARRFLAIAG